MSQSFSPRYAMHLPSVMALHFGAQAQQTMKIDAHNTRARTRLNQNNLAHHLCLPLTTLFELLSLCAVWIHSLCWSEARETWCTLLAAHIEEMNNSKHALRATTISAEQCPRGLQYTL